MKHAYDPATQLIPVVGRRQPVAGLIAGTVAGAVAGILGLGAIVYHFTATDTPEETAAASTAAPVEPTADDATVFAQDATGPGSPAGPDATENVAVPGATTATAAAQQGVTAGAFCSPAGATGKTPTGVTMRCTRAAGESRARWRAAPAATTTTTTGTATKAPTTAPTPGPTTKAPTTAPTTKPTTKPTTTPATAPTTTAPPVTETTTAAPPVAAS